MIKSVEENYEAAFGNHNYYSRAQRVNIQTLQYATGSAQM